MQRPCRAESEKVASGVDVASERQRSEKRLERPQGEQFGSLGTRGKGFIFFSFDLSWAG